MHYLRIGMIVLLLLSSYSSQAQSDKQVYDMVLRNIETTFNKDVQYQQFHPTKPVFWVVENRKCLGDHYLNVLIREGRIKGLSYQPDSLAKYEDCVLAKISSGDFTLRNNIKIRHWDQFSKVYFDDDDLLRSQYPSSTMIRLQYSNVLKQGDVYVVMVLVKIGNGSFRSGHAYLYEFEMNDKYSLRNVFFLQ